LTHGFGGAKFRFVSKTYATVSIVLGLVFLFIGALDVRGHFGIWAASSILFGFFLIVFGASFGVDAKRQKARRRVSFGFLGAAMVLLAVALALFRS
jgi:hydrogenase-4 membrane subunit HyfE